MWEPSPQALFRDIEQFDTIAVVGKVWGYELWHFNTDTLCMKTLVIYPGHACSFHSHEVKYEIFTCLDSGPTNQLYITVGNQPERLLKRGEHVVIHPGVDHTFSVHGTQPGALLEFSTHHKEGDSYRVWSSHQFAGGGGMSFLGDVSELKGRKVLVVGDIALDEYWSGECTRLSPEAAVPLINMDPYAPDIRQMPGCVGNVAVNVNALGGKAAIVSLIGDDRPGEDLIALLNELTITTDHVLTSELRPTSVKRRIFARQQYITRVDTEVETDFTDDMEKPVLREIISALDEFEPDVVFAADYDKGFLTKEVISSVVAYAHERDIPVIADPKVRHFTLYDDVDILKPNDVRAGTAMEMPTRTISEVEALARTIRERMQCKAVCLTRGGKGMYLLSDEVDQHIQAIPVGIAELSGAGDTAGAALALATAGGMSLPDAAHIANVAASVVVQKTGTESCTPTELAEALAQT